MKTAPFSFGFEAPGKTSENIQVTLILVCAQVNSSINQITRPFDSTIPFIAQFHHADYLDTLQMYGKVR
jgi:hypothetical protein